MEINETITSKKNVKKEDVKPILSFKCEVKSTETKDFKVYGIKGELNGDTKNVSAVAGTIVALLKKCSDNKDYYEEVLSKVVKDLDLIDEDDNEYFCNEQNQFDYKELKDKIMGIVNKLKESLKEE